MIINWLNCNPNLKKLAKFFSSFLSFPSWAVDDKNWIQCILTDKVLLKETLLLVFISIDVKAFLTILVWQFISKWALWRAYNIFTPKKWFFYYHYHFKGTEKIKIIIIIETWQENSPNNHKSTKVEWFVFSWNFTIKQGWWEIPRSRHLSFVKSIETKVWESWNNTSYYYCKWLYVTKVARHQPWTFLPVLHHTSCLKYILTKWLMM